MPETPETPHSSDDAGSSPEAGTPEGSAAAEGSASPDAAGGREGSDAAEEAEAPETAEDAAAAAPDDAEPVNLVEAAVLEAAARVTLPFQAARADRSFATAFWYNDLVETAAGHEVIRQYLVTAESRTRYELGQFTLRDGLAAPELPADELVLPSFARKWTRLGDLGVAVMPTTDLHIHAEKRGWHWTTDEVTAGLAAQPADIAQIGAEPLPAYALGHTVEEQAGRKHPDRPQVLLPGAVTRTSDDPAAPVRWTTPLPDGFAGAPVFAAVPMDDDQIKLVCLGLLLPAIRPVAPRQAPEGAPAATTPAASATVVTFDLLRPAIHAVTPSLKRHWWQRR
ncbi:hypothetical protein [Actinacidiphila acidipaludis]|uniref:Uncharacterized protein n=1 Tax=Actinacidiphila acidipaludis TaxID=2873382 RepID=A0ABS7Q239_9ACTN|nr:hypothetical protein [Streptomyces acidipaludis]MBY8877038.1 hypothetical protein [Streptomyces acidipaludis]